MQTSHWLQVRKAGGGEGDWMRLRKYPDEGDALIGLVEQRAGSQPQWEFRVARLNAHASEPEAVLDHV